MTQQRQPADTKLGMWSIGEVSIGGPLVLGPLAGYSSAPFRFLCRRAGANLVYSEMVAARGIDHGNRKTFELMHIWRGEHPVALQIFGERPGVMARAMGAVAEAGADIIDINMGCPVPKVIRSGSGADLMKDPERAIDIASAVVDSTGDLPVTCKIRAGADADDDSYVELGGRLEGAGIAAIAIHARTVEQGFDGEADHRHTARLVDALDIPVIASGDVFQPADAERILDGTGCAAVMLARGAIGNPWLFSRTAAFLRGEGPVGEVSLALRLGVALCQAQMLVAERGQRRGMNEMRGQLAAYTRGLPGSRRFRNRVNNTHTLPQLAKVMREYVNRVADG